MSLGTIEAYAYQADLYCPGCIVEILTGEKPLYGATEAILRDVALSMGIDRDSEDTFDSGDFPKVILGQDLNNPDCDNGILIPRWDHCGSCEDCLDHDTSDCKVMIMCEEDPADPRYGHMWVGGMCYVDPEDVDMMAAVRTVECERCEKIYVPREEN